MLCDITKMCDQKNKLVNITKKKQTHRCREQTSDYQWREGRGRGVRGLETQTSMYKINCKYIL